MTMIKLTDTAGDPVYLDVSRIYHIEARRDGPGERVVGSSVYMALGNDSDRVPVREYPDVVAESMRAVTDLHIRVGKR